MAFNSFLYYLFLPVVYLTFYFTPDRYRWLVLLCASYGFYATLNAPYLLVALFMVTCLSYSCGLRIAEYQDETFRKRWLWIGVAGCLATLAIFKYLPLQGREPFGVLGLSGALSKAVISIGVSYYTFQAISYQVDVYLEIEEPEKHFGLYALYLAFFPKLLQGPIERAGDLLPQLKQPYQFDHDKMRSGMLLFSWGLFKKVVIADRLSLMVNAVYNDVHSFTGISLILATYLYAMQIYFDFSGYTDMALGTARMFNINLTQNFNSPYAARSIADFWRKWHISFSNWILDYIFKPLQMRWREAKTWGTASALIVTFLVSGLWHGASWGFIVWGLLHGLYLAMAIFCKPFQKKIQKKLHLEKTLLLKVWQTAVTFNLVCFAWIFFRANTFADALYVVTHLFSGVDGQIMSVVITSGKISLAILAMALLVFNLVNLAMKYTDIPNTFYAKPMWFRWPVYYGSVTMSLLCNVDVDTYFIYFKF